MSTEHHLVVPRTARYHQLGTPSAATRRVWFVCHGYRQLAAYFIRHFAALAAADPGLVVVAPEGLSRFYLHGHDGRVGTSWMTRDDRQHEIDDQIGFLNKLVGHVLGRCPAGVPVTLLGFSQGTATVGRWLVQAPFRPAHLVLWAGTFPPDTNPEATEQLVRNLPITLVVGEHDEYLTPSLVAQQQAHLRQMGALLAVRTFTGGHALNQEILAQLGSVKKA
ncbi:alpha/beta hydrolase [Hymenobacter sp. PAMC 26628]|uniref:alpha/beta hydrolase n=1 Tax=Hymenobacter sp. PAMC 26628 TaxID=1484118 RepID=UPI0007702E79|nr:phospholipase [Hymenobacter sp. PAMC 26628]AMJ65482.1 phospholipase [Hymenobacter sp. PAMC 26628]